MCEQPAVRFDFYLGTDQIILMKSMMRKQPLEHVCRSNKLQLVGGCHLDATPRKNIGQAIIASKNTTVKCIHMSAIRYEPLPLFK
jgi:hypothetical protein